MTTAIMWSFSLRLRAKNSSGVVQHTYAPTSETMISWEISHEDVVEERELLDRTRDDECLGFYRHYLVSLTIPDGKFTGDTGASDLETVLSDRFTSGNYLEISTNGGSTYVKVRVADDTGPNRAGAKNTALHREIDFTTCALVTTDSAPEALD